MLSNTTTNVFGNSTRVPTGVVAEIDGGYAMVKLDMRAVPAKNKPKELIFIVDNSLSMRERTAKFLEESCVLVTYATETTLIVFGCKATVVGTATTKSDLEELISTIPPQGMTNITDGVMTGLECIQRKAKSDPDAVYQIAFLSDGVHNTGVPPLETIEGGGTMISNKMSEILAEYPDIQIYFDVLGVGSTSQTNTGMALKSVVETIPTRCDELTIHFCEFAHDMGSIILSLIETLTKRTDNNVLEIKTLNGTTMPHAGNPGATVKMFSVSPGDETGVYFVTEGPIPSSILVNGEEVVLKVGNVCEKTLISLIQDMIYGVTQLQVGAQLPKEELLAAIESISVHIDFLELKSREGETGDSGLSTAEARLQCIRKKVQRGAECMANQLRNEIEKLRTYDCTSSKGQAAYLTGCKGKNATRARQRNTTNFTEAIATMTQLAQEVGTMLQLDLEGQTPETEGCKVSYLTLQTAKDLMNELKDFSPESDSVPQTEMELFVTHGLMGILVQFSKRDDVAQNDPYNGLFVGRVFSDPVDTCAALCLKTMHPDRREQVRLPSGDQVDFLTSDVLPLVDWGLVRSTRLALLSKIYDAYYSMMVNGDFEMYCGSEVRMAPYAHALRSVLDGRLTTCTLDLALQLVYTSKQHMTVHSTKKRYEKLHLRFLDAGLTITRKDEVDHVLQLLLALVMIDAPELREKRAELFGKLCNEALSRAVKQALRNDPKSLTVQAMLCIEQGSIPELAPYGEKELDVQEIREICDATYCVDTRLVDSFAEQHLVPIFGFWKFANALQHKAGCRKGGLDTLIVELEQHGSGNLVESLLPKNQPQGDQVELSIIDQIYKELPDEECLAIYMCDAIQTHRRTGGPDSLPGANQTLSQRAIDTRMLGYLQLKEELKRDRQKNPSRLADLKDVSADAFEAILGLRRHLHADPHDLWEYIEVALECEAGGDDLKIQSILGRVSAELPAGRKYKRMKARIQGKHARLKKMQTEHATSENV